MALILDKSIITTTYYDIDGDEVTGSTVTGLTNLSYETDSGIILDNPYLVIDEITLDKYNKYIKIKTLLFKDNDGRNNGKLPIENNSYMIHNNNELYDNYFSIINMENINIFESSYNYIKENILTNWKTDE